MARVIMEIRALLELGSDEEEVRESIETALRGLESELVGSSKVPVAFGIEALKLLVRAPEREGISSAITEAMEKIKGISSVEIERMSRA